MGSRVNPENISRILDAKIKKEVQNNPVVKGIQRASKVVGKRISNASKGNANYPSRSASKASAEQDNKQKVLRNRKNSDEMNNANEKLAVEECQPQISAEQIEAVREKLREKAAEMPRIQQEMVLLLDGSTGLQALKRLMMEAAVEGNSSFFVSCADSFLRKCEKLDALNQKYTQIVTIDPDDIKLADLDSAINDYVQRLSCPFREKECCEDLLSLGKELKTEWDSESSEVFLQNFAKKHGILTDNTIPEEELIDETEPREGQ